MASGDPPDASPKGSGEKTKKLSQKEQSERFKEAARELEVDESGEAFNAVLSRVLPAPD